MDRKGRESFRKGRGLRWWGRGGKVSKLTSTEIKKISWCQNKPLYLLLCIAFIASKPKIQLVFAKFKNVCVYELGGGCCSAMYPFVPNTTRSERIFLINVFYQSDSVAPSS